MITAKPFIVAVAIAICATVTGPLSAQDTQRGRPAPGPPAAEDAVSPAEIQRLFDAYVMMQAQQTLQLGDEQFPRFLARVKVLQEARRRGQMQRGRILQEIRKLLQTTGQDDALRTQLKALNELDARVDTEVRQALDGVDQVLDLRQQARFRLFEEQMERRKVDLLMRARQAQANRSKN
jgi:hypothetical protein